MEIDKRVFDCIRTVDCAAAAEITVESSLEALGLDSLDRIEVVMAIEESFKIEIDDKAFETIRTVADLIKLVTELVSDPK